MRTVHYYEKHSLTTNVVRQVPGFIKEDKRTVTFARTLSWQECHLHDLSYILGYTAELEGRPRITLRTEKDGSVFDFTRHVVTVDGAQMVFATLRDAMDYLRNFTEGLYRVH